MFTTKERLIKRTGKNAIGRYEFLKLLATEFKTTKSKEAKEQVLANLANFAYDPINYGYIRQLQIIDLFLYALSEDNVKLVRFAAGGICNLCVDPINKFYILRNRGIQLLTSLLSSQDEDILLSIIACLIYLNTPEAKDQITRDIIDNISELSSNHQSNRVKNLAIVFLNDHSKTMIEPKDTKYSFHCSHNRNCSNLNMKLAKTVLEFLKKYCTGTDLANSTKGFRDMKTANEISVFRTITNDDILNFSKLTNDYNTVHTGSANNLVHGAFLNGLVSGVLGTKIPGPGTIVVQQNLAYPNPCYAEDKVEIKVQILSRRKIIKCEYICIANGEKIVLKGDAKLIKNS
ncbi:LOW QUALITY PROTEIN: uncharacterized protein LOC143218453 [Lasioglossum baleicum]|uniref:LOW QUALITY PROTEIN: uncharacterized protein LOC143218453 n=1 Tax=Lasioglossum baleicum TaxID=434251 RepID=UPI003FCDD4EE